MTRTVWQKSWVRFLTTVLTIAVLMMIFAFSTENAEDSDKTSGVFSMQIIRLFHPDYERMQADEQKTLYDRVQYIIRKCAHFTEYTALGFLIRLCLESWIGHRMKKSRIKALIGFGAGTAYACSDEIHQMSIDGRSGQWTDLLVDGSGVLAGVMLASLLIRKLSD
ncbi:MAG: VanZ family protein [Clostridia bacterium]|nr:VanZ family protein [Clostridia bacterium]